MNANRETVNLPVGIDKYGDIYIARDFFKYADGFQGVTGDVVRAVEMREIDDACTDDNMAEYLRDIWADQVRADMTDDGLADWISDNVPLDEYIDMRFEPANVDVEALHALTGGIGDVERYEIVGCGRVFHAETEWARVFDADLLARIHAWEANK